MSLQSEGVKLAIIARWSEPVLPAVMMDEGLMSPQYKQWSIGIPNGPANEGQLERIK